MQLWQFWLRVFVRYLITKCLDAGKSLCLAVATLAIILSIILGAIVTTTSQPEPPQAAIEEEQSLADKVEEKVAKELGDEIIIALYRVFPDPSRN